MRAIIGIVLVLALSADAETVAPLHVPRSSQAIQVDGRLDDAVWNEAAVIDRFYETNPGDNAEPRVRTRAYVTYDADSFYVGLRADDPSPKNIRAPFVDRDQVLQQDDNIAVYLDTRNDARSAVELLVNPRGIQGDAVYNDANFREDFSPDFFYDSAAVITEDGWTAELRIPFTSLRYDARPVQTWRILIARNYPREFRYTFHSAPIPRNANCIICKAHVITGMTGLPSAGHIVAAPYSTARQAETRNATGSAATGFERGDPQIETGVDVKWNPTASSTFDLTLNPDFSQVESDAAQLSVNERFALFYAEKRPFFLESVDLFDTPIRAVHTRTITAPRWGARTTGRLGASAYTLLVTEDRGGGSAIVPGPLGSSFAPRDFSSIVAIGRVRRSFGQSFAGLLLTTREADGGGHSRLFGPDFQWRPTAADTIIGQYLYSSTETPRRADLHGTWTGEKLAGHAAHVRWTHRTARIDWRLAAGEVGKEFRAETGFVPQVGYQQAQAGFGYTSWFEKGLISSLRYGFFADAFQDPQSRLLSRDVSGSVLLLGRKNLGVFAAYRPAAVTRVGNRLLEHSFAELNWQIDPSRRLPRIQVASRFGEMIDFAHARVGTGMIANAAATFRPTERLELLLSASRQTLDLDEEDAKGRLFTQRIERLRATYSFTGKSLVRAIGEYVSTERDPSLYGFTVRRRDGTFLGTLLYSYKLNWQTVLFAGYGDSGVLDHEGDRFGTERSLFVKVSYAYQR